ncbi:O-antigen polysaccharide polymerase Wzy [Psychrobacter sp. AOP29-E1-7]|uniref:O-antigen polysaccharide polymerase Wzy n=1 Tax=Psychrobacter sp. AOP29-E1-7 TaxID=3457702 RepID=UPI0040365FDA
MIRANHAIIFLNTIVLILALFVYNFVSYSFSDDFVFYVLLVVMIITIIFFFKNEPILALRKNFFKHSNLVLIGLFIVGFQKYLDYYLGYIHKYDLFMNVSENSVAKSMIVALIGLTSFYIGFLIKKDSYQKSLVVFKSTQTKLISILSSFFLLAFLFNVNPAYVFGGYGIYDMGINAVYFSVLFKASYFALVIQKIINIKQSNTKLSGVSNYLKFIGNTNIILLCLYLLVVILSGDRGDIIVFSLLLLIGYLISTGKKFGLVKSAVIIGCASLLLTTLGIARSFNSSENSSFIQNINKAINGEGERSQHKSIIPATSELAESVKAIHYSIEYVPKHHDYLYTRFPVTALISVIPFSSSIFPYVFEDTSLKYTSSDNFVTWLIVGVDNPASGQGTSLLADFYLSYGISGIIFGMLFFGWLVRYCEQQLDIEKNERLIFFIISIIVFCSSIYLARSSLFSPIRLISWTWLIVVFNKKIALGLRR